MAVAGELIAAPERWTVQEYLERERVADVKSEYYGGDIVMMAGGSPEHALIAASLIASLGASLAGSSCRVYTADLKVRSSPSQYVYPDVTVICGDLEHDDADPYVATNPRLVVEVVSPSTEYYDRTVKWLRYQFLPSLTDYLLVAQEQPLVEHFWREGDGHWRYASSLGMDAELVVTSLDCRIPLRRIYAGVTFGAQ